MTSKRSSKSLPWLIPNQPGKIQAQVKNHPSHSPNALVHITSKTRTPKKTKKVKNYINSSQSLSFCHSNYSCIPKAFVFVCLFFKFYLTFTSGSLFLRPLSLQYITYTLIYTLHIHRQKEKTKKSERQRERNWKWGLWRNKRRFLTRKQRRRWWRSWEMSFWVVRLGAMSGEWRSWKTFSRCLRIVNKISSKLFTLTSPSPSSSPQSTRLFHDSMNALFVLCLDRKSVV